MKTNSSIEAVIFDLDGCLVDSEPLSLESIAVEMRKLGISDASAGEIGAKFLGIGIPVICDYVAEKLGRPCPDDFATTVENRLIKSYEIDLQTIEGVVPMLEALRSKSVGIAVATGGSLHRMRRTLEISKLLDFFSLTACSVDEVANGKPAPDIFLKAAAKLNTAPEKCMVLEDSPHGVRGAVKAGMTVIGFVGGSHLDGGREAHRQVLLNAGAIQVIDHLDNAADKFLGDACLGNADL